MNIDAYLERMIYRGPLQPSAETLRQLHLAHMLAVPFENLSIHAAEPIVLEEAALFDKIVGRRRGGFCYELNGLFAALLRELGFEVTMLAAEVWNDTGDYGPAFDHMTLQVTLDEPWLVDVGFGDSFREPLRLAERGPQVQGERAYRIQPEGDYLVMSQRKPDDQDWQPQYRFTLDTYTFPDYAAMCHYHQTSPESGFTQRRVCSRATPEGRITLRDRRLIVTQNGQRHEHPLPDDATYHQALREHFGITMDG